MFDPEVETRPWRDQASLDDVLYRRQVAYLLARSAFYQSKLGEAGFATADEIRGLDSIDRLPFTEKDEIRASCSAEHPIGTHLAVPAIFSEVRMAPPRSTGHRHAQLHSLDGAGSR